MSQSNSEMRTVRNQKFMLFKKMPRLFRAEVDSWIIENKIAFGGYFSSLAKGKLLKRVHSETGEYRFVGVNANILQDYYFGPDDIVGDRKSESYKAMVSMLFELEIDLMPPRVEGFEGERYDPDNGVTKWVGEQLAHSSKAMEYLFNLAVYNGYINENPDTTWEGVDYKK